MGKKLPVTVIAVIASKSSEFKTVDLFPGPKYTSIER